MPTLHLLQVGVMPMPVGGNLDADTNKVSAASGAVADFPNLDTGSVYELSHDGTVDGVCVITQDGTTPDVAAGAGDGFYWLPALIPEKQVFLLNAAQTGGTAQTRIQVHNGGTVTSIFSIRRLA